MTALHDRRRAFRLTTPLLLASTRSPEQEADVLKSSLVPPTTAAPAPGPRTLATEHDRIEQITNRC
jgi:hypothetical protein